MNYFLKMPLSKFFMKQNYWINKKMNTLEIFELLNTILEKEIKVYKIKEGYGLEDDLELSELEDLLYQECDMNLDQLELIVERLLPLCQIAKSELTNKVYQGFGKDNMWIIKREIQLK